MTDIFIHQNKNENELRPSDVLDAVNTSRTDVVK